MRFLGAEKPQHPSAEYYPNSAGSLQPGSAKTYSFLILGREDRAIQSQVLNALYRHGARVLTQLGYVDETTREFTLCVSCDLTSANITPDDFVIELRRMKPVTNALSVCLKDRIFDGFLFPMTFMTSNRVVVINSSLTLQIQDRFASEEERLALRDVGRDFALDIVRQVKARLGPNRPASAVQENVRGYLRAAGWGTFAWDSEAAFERVTITDPPTSSKGEAAGNYFVQGMGSGLVEAFRSKRYTVAEEVYNREKRTLTIMLSEIRTAQVDKKAPKIPKSVEISALEEVEKVIKSVQRDEDDEDQTIVALASTSARGRTTTSIPQIQYGSEVEEDSDEDEESQETEQQLPRKPVAAPAPKLRPQIHPVAPPGNKPQLPKELAHQKEQVEEVKRKAVAPQTVKSIRVKAQEPQVEVMDEDEAVEEEEPAREPTKRQLPPIQVKKVMESIPEEEEEEQEEVLDELPEQRNKVHVSLQVKKPKKLAQELDEPEQGDEAQQSEAEASVAAETVEENATSQKETEEVQTSVQKRQRKPVDAEEESDETDLVSNAPDEGEQQLQQDENSMWFEPVVLE
jgi:hypothetical protein